MRSARRAFGFDRPRSVTLAAALSEPYVLLGMRDSPIARRVATTLELYALPSEDLPLRTVGEAARFREIPPRGSALDK